MAAEQTQLDSGLRSQIISRKTANKAIATKIGQRRKESAPGRRKGPSVLGKAKFTGGRYSSTGLVIVLHGR